VFKGLMFYTSVVIMYTYVTAHRMPVMDKGTVIVPTKATNQLTS